MKNMKNKKDKLKIVVEGKPFTLDPEEKKALDDFMEERESEINKFGFLGSSIKNKKHETN